jgi:hypothetical protein
VIIERSLHVPCRYTPLCCVLSLSLPSTIRRAIEIQTLEDVFSYS